MSNRTRPTRVGAMLSVAAFLLSAAGCGTQAKQAATPMDAGAPVLTTLAQPMNLPDAEESVPVEFLVDGENVWLRTLGPPYLRRVDEAKIGVEPVDTDRLIDEVAVGNGRLWATTMDPETQDRSVMLVSASEPADIVDKAMPVGCEPAGGTVFQDEFWVYCGDSLLAYAVRVREAVRRLHGMPPSPLLAADDGLWRVSGRRVTALAGDAIGRSWPLRHVSAVRWTAAGHFAWALDETDSGSVLVRVDLATGDEREFPITTGPAFPLDLEPVGREIWVTTDGATVLRFEPERSAQPVGEIVFGRTSQSGSTVHLAAGAGYAWVVFQTGANVETFKLGGP